MTELQIAIGHLKETISVGNVLLGKLEKGQKDSEKILPYKWKHGDVFENKFQIPMICIDNNTLFPAEMQVFCLTGGACDCHHHSVDFLPKGKFLFNIKEKL